MAARQGEPPFVTYAAFRSRYGPARSGEARQQVDTLVAYTLGNPSTEQCRVFYVGLIRLRDGDGREKLTASWRLRQISVPPLDSPNWYLTVTFLYRFETRSRSRYGGTRRSCCASMPSCCSGTTHRVPSRPGKRNYSLPWRSRESNRQCRGNSAAPRASRGCGGVMGESPRRVTCWLRHTGISPRDSAPATSSTRPRPYGGYQIGSVSEVKSR